MNPHSFFDLSLWCIRFYFIIRFSLSNTPFVVPFLVVHLNGNEHGAPQARMFALPPQGGALTGAPHKWGMAVFLTVHFFYAPKRNLTA